LARPRDGARWTPVGGTLAGESALALAVNPSTAAVYAGTARGLYTLDNERWKLADPILAGRRVAALAFSADGTRLYAAADDGFFVLD
jgi:hypothetical protein